MNPKPLYLKDNLSRFKDFQYKIIHRVLDDLGAKKIPKDDTWEHERFTRHVHTEKPIERHAPSFSCYISCADCRA